MGAIWEKDRIISFISKANHSTSTVIQVYVSTINAKEAEANWFDEVLQHLELTPKKKCPFLHGGLESKIGNQSLVISEITGKFGLGIQNKNKARKRQTQFYQENILVMANTFPTTQEMTLHINIPDGQYQNCTDYVLCSQRWRSSIQSAKTNLKLTVAQIMSSILKNSGLNWKK